MARSPAEWAALSVGEDVGLLLGWRPGRDRLEGRPVEIAADVRDLLRETAQESLAELGRRRRRPLSGVPALEPGEEYLSVELPDLRRVASTGDADGGLPEAVPPDGDADATEVAADLLRLIEAARRDPDYLERSQIADGHFLFHAVTGTLSDGEPAAFVRQTNPKRGLETGRFVTAYRNTLSRVDDPVLIFDEDVDLIVTPTEIAVLGLTAFDRLFADLDLAVAQVPASLDRVVEALPLELPEAVRGVIVDATRGRRSLAKQLRRLATADHLHLVTATALREKLGQHGLETHRFGTGDALELAGGGDVPILLDLLEQLYYEADFSGEHRRADRYSRRP